MSTAVARRGQLDIRLFGHLEVTLDGARFKLATPRKTLQVLVYLLLHRGTPVSRDYLAFLLYPDDEEDSARAKLRATLSALPKILPAPGGRYVTIDGDRVAWNPDAELWLDVEAFERASTDRARLAEAIDLYRGDLMPEMYDEWLEAIRERYRNTFLRCLNEQISEARRNADLTLAIETARKMLGLDPWREDIVRRLIALRYESGDRAGALREYTSFSQRLRAEMNAEPMAETSAVAERITRGEAPPEEDDGERSPLASGSAVLPFVGRRDETAQLLEMWSRAARGRGACAFVGGEPGIGKSRIALEFAHTVEDRGGRVLFGTTSSPEAIPYESVVDALRSAPSLVGSLKPNMALACVAALLPEIGARTDLPAVPRLDAQSERIRLFESLFRCLADLAAPRPLLLVLEDLHWAQSASLELLQFLVRRIAGTRVMVVATYRDEESPQLQAFHRLRREARATSNAQSFWLSRLSVDDVEQLRAALPEVRERPADELITATQGSPLFLAQIVVDIRQDAASTLAPASLQEVVARRIDRLSEPARTAAEIAACIGDRFSRDAAREVSAWDDATLTDALDELLDSRIIREAGTRGILEYAFIHQLVHAEILRAVRPEDAAVRRRRVARVLERLYPERFSELSLSLARHYEAAGDVANAARCYLEAVRRSISIGALQEARAHCERALVLEPDSRARANLLLESFRIESRVGDRKRQDAALRALEGIEGELSDPAIHRSLLLDRMEYAASTSDRAAFDRAARALRDSLTDDDLAGHTALSLAESKMEYAQGRLNEAYAAGEAALARSRAAGDDAGVMRALCAMALVHAHRGPLSAADALFAEAAEVAARAADPVLELLALSSGWTIAYQRRDLRRCRALGERCLELAVALGDRPAEAQAHGRLGVSLAAAGTGYAQAREHYAAARRIYAETGNPSGSAGPLMNEALLEMKLGFFDRATAATQAAMKLFERANDERGRVGGLNNLVFLHGINGRIDEARPSAEEGLASAAQHGYGLFEISILENLAAAEAWAGNYARAIEIAEPLLALRSQSDSEVWTSVTLANLGIWYARLGNVDASREAMRKMLADDDAIMQGTDWPSLCYWSAAQIFQLDGKRAEAVRLLERARQVMRENADQLDPEDRERFLALQWHADLTKAVEADVWPDPPR